jgi:hypothetical protein
VIEHEIAKAGRANYEAYCAAVKGLSVRGDILLTWEQLCSASPDAAAAWSRGAAAVADLIARDEVWS